MDFYIMSRDEAVAKWQDNNLEILKANLLPAGAIALSQSPLISFLYLPISVHNELNQTNRYVSLSLSNII